MRAKSGVSSCCRAALVNESGHPGRCDGEGSAIGERGAAVPGQSLYWLVLCEPQTDTWKVAMRR